MDEEALNISVRKFLKKVGVTSQREIEAAFRDAMAKGRIDLATHVYPAEATIIVDALGLVVKIDGDLLLVSQNPGTQ